MTRRSVVLPQPEGPISETNSPRSTVEVDVGERLHRAVGGLEGERQVADVDDDAPPRPRAARAGSIVGARFQHIPPRSCTPRSLPIAASRAT